MKNQIIVVMGGSFNPPTIAHLRVLQAAADAMNADKGIFVPSSHAYVRRKMGKQGRPDEVLSEETRLAMLEAMAKEDCRLTVDDLEYYRTEKAYTYETMEALQMKYPDATLYFVAGGDKIDIFPRWHRIREFLDRFHIVVFKRDGEDPDAELASSSFLSERRHMFHVVDAPEGIEEISSSAVRQKLRNGEDGMESLLHPAVYAMLKESVGVNPEINFFREEYAFLSNFFSTEVRYGGLTYQNAEAAFQAQKCMSEEEKLPFTDMNPGRAKSLGRRVSLRPDWEEVKVGLMEEIVRAKFTQNPQLADQLLATGNKKLIEGNTWNDIFWGVDLRTGKGQNHLGILLMKIREELKVNPIESEV